MTSPDETEIPRRTRGWVRRRLIAIVGSPAAARSRTIRDSQRGERAAADLLYPQPRRVTATPTAASLSIGNGRDVATSGRSAQGASTSNERDT